MKTALIVRASNCKTGPLWAGRLLVIALVAVVVNQEGNHLQVVVVVVAALVEAQAAVEVQAAVAVQVSLVVVQLAAALVAPEEVIQVEAEGGDMMKMMMMMTMIQTNKGKWMISLSQEDMK